MLFGMGHPNVKGFCGMGSRSRAHFVSRTGRRVRRLRRLRRLDFRTFFRYFYLGFMIKSSLLSVVFPASQYHSHIHKRI